LPEQNTIDWYLEQQKVIFSHFRDWKFPVRVPSCLVLERALLAFRLVLSCSVFPDRENKEASLLRFLLVRTLISL
jgi:hypothetical protein